MAIADKNGLIIESNPRFNELMEALSGFGNTQTSTYLSIRETLRFANFFSRLTSGMAKRVEFTAPFHDRQNILHWFRIHAWVVAPFPDTESPFPGDPFIGFTMVDKTKERQEGERLQEDKEVAERAMEARNQFLTNISHEIRTPIQTIIGMIELLQDTKLDQEQTEYSGQIKFAAEVLLSLINDILDLSKIEAGRMELESTAFGPERTIEQAVEMIALEAHKKGLEIALDISPELDITILGDPNKFRQIVINLVKNAVKFTREGSVTISARLTEQEGRETITVAIADTGIGIPEESRNHLFTTFFQADPSNTRSFGGTGLGLAISRNLVELMGGKIGMTPREGGGSIFYFSIPIKRPDFSISSESASVVRKNPDNRILLVDDWEESRGIIGSYLKNIGYQNIGTAVSGENALELLRAAVQEKKPYGLCLIDMIMPRMDGWRLAAEINQDKAINDVRLILMIPHGFLGAEAKMTLLRWFNAYIYKPIERKDLAKIITQTFSEPPVDLEAALEQEGLSLSEKVQSGEIFRDLAGPEAGPEAIPDASAPTNTAGKPLVLIVEDHPVNQKVFAIILEKLGYTFITADDGLDALEKAGVHPIDLVFMDIQMPRMNGYEAAKKLREWGFDKPIIAVTASVLLDEGDQCVKAGINDILLKPVKRSDIEGILHKWMPLGAGGNRPLIPRSQNPGQGLLAKAHVYSRPGPKKAAAASPIEAPRSSPSAISPNKAPPVPSPVKTPQTGLAAEAPPIASPPSPRANPVLAASLEVERASPIWVTPARVTPAVPAAPVFVTKRPGVFNRRDLLNTFLEDTEAIKPLLDHFLTRTEIQINELPILAEQENWGEARRIAHTIKGSALTLSGLELGQAAARLEQAYKTINRDEIQAGLPPLREAFTRFRTEGKKFIGE
jgi:signal transduction histidine kinase/response regulator RpfG family c-di-GMP phosphodiesterase/HPt (histidine-containing phosphotransfer) domain-containing protein